MKFLMLALIGLSLSASAQNSLSLVATGNYGANYYSEKAPFRIVRNNNNVTLTDIENKITFALNLSETQPQHLPQEYIKMLRNRGATAGAASVIQDITVSDIKLSPITSPKGEPNKRESRVDGKLTFIIGYNSPFGSLNATVVMNAEAVLVREKRTWGYLDSKTKKYESKEMELSWIRASAGDFVRLTQFQSTLPDALNNIVGMLLDLGVRIGGLSLRSTEYIHQIP